MKKIICVVGPTASGKTRLAVALAQHFGGEVVSCDSMQIYRGMTIGTAKPTPEEMQGIAHHMIDILEPWEDFSVSRYVELADACVQDILGRGKPVILAGGTGLYLDSLIAGRTFAPFPATGCRERLMQRAEQIGPLGLWQELQQVDPAAAAAIPPGNVKRVVRALEIFQETGTTITEHNRRTRQLPARYDPLWIGLDFEHRSALYARIDRRVEQMVQQGLVEEVRQLLARGIDPAATSLQAIGYKELVGHLEGRCSLESALEEIQRGSRRYAKRQRTWFYRNEKVHWLLWQDEPDFEGTLARAIALAEAGEP